MLPSRTAGSPPSSLAIQRERSWWRALEPVGAREWVTRRSLTGAWGGGRSSEVIWTWNYAI